MRVLVILVRRRMMKHNGARFYICSKIPMELEGAIEQQQYCIASLLWFGLHEGFDARSR